MLNHFLLLLTQFVFYTRVFNAGAKRDLKTPIYTFEGAMDVVSSLWLMTSTKKARLSSGRVFFPSAMEYQQLVTTCKYANVSQINAIVQ